MKTIYGQNKDNRCHKVDKTGMGERRFHLGRFFGGAPFSHTVYIADGFKLFWSSTGAFFEMSRKCNYYDDSAEKEDDLIINKMRQYILEDGVIHDGVGVVYDGLKEWASPAVQERMLEMLNEGFEGDWAAMEKVLVEEGFLREAIALFTPDDPEKKVKSCWGCVHWDEVCDINADSDQIIDPYIAIHANEAGMTVRQAIASQCPSYLPKELI